MRLKNIALGCTLTGALACLVLPTAPARADNRSPDRAQARPRLTISAPAADYAYGARAGFTVTLGPTFSSREVSLYASPYGERRQFVASGDVNALGEWHPSYLITRETTFTVFFGGDSLDAANNAHIVLQAHARVTDSITGYFKQARAGGITYAVFHANGTLTLHSTVYPAKHGECLEPETEQLNGSAWGTDTKYGCDRLDAASQDTAPFSVNRAVGDRYRIRGDYFRGSKDLANLSQQGPWLYFEVVK